MDDVGAGVSLMAGAGDELRAATHTGIGMDAVELMHFMPGQGNLATFDRRTLFDMRAQAVGAAYSGFGTVNGSTIDLLAQML
jgi:hypothetical protein